MNVTNDGTKQRHGLMRHREHIMTSVSAKNESSEPNHEEELDILQNNCLLWALKNVSVVRPRKAEEHFLIKEETKLIR